ncbi:MAG: DUF1800 domain-containing protein, partial [Planctomycetes bacterium]|nr:DUF1800 domain-containing protein [Planctomycetota bacterium]
MLPTLLSLAALLPSAPVPQGKVDWNPRNAEHLLNRAGFGGTVADIEAATAAGLGATIERLLARATPSEMPAYERIVEPTNKELEGLPKEEQDKRRRAAREADRRQMLETTAWWFREMSRSESPLQEKLTLFWHGFFTTSIEDAKRSFIVIQQHEFLRENALGSYADLLRGIAQDPAMLVYLDNNVNRKGSPNENFARELMELFSLGEGNYTEADVKEAARALTGRGTDREGRYEFRARQHDDGEKTILGVKGRIDGDRLIEILLEQEACPRWVARRLLAWFEGVEPDARRLDEYARFLRVQHFQIRPFLRKLFADPRFYRDEVVGARVLSPVEYMIGMARRAQVDAPPGLLGAGAALLGQRVFSPPSVKGWEEGHAWITTSTLMQRGNLAGMLLGVVKVADVMSMADVEAEMAAAGTPGGEPMGEGPRERGPGPESRPARDAGAGGAAGSKPPAAKAKAPRANPAMDILRRVESSGWYPLVNFRARLERAGVATDAEIVDRLLDELLAIQAPADTRARLRAFLAAERQQLGLADGALLTIGGQAERV